MRTCNRSWVASVMLALVLVFWSSGSAFGLAVTPTDDGTMLVNTIVGSGITIVPGSISYIGTTGQAGTFTNGLASGMGINSGILLTTGSAAGAVGPNNVDGFTAVTGTGGNATLDTLLLSNFTTHDQNVLEFRFTTAGGNLFFNYVFASEEYNEFVNSDFNDVLGFFLDGVNIAFIPGTTIPVAINNVNGGNPLGIDASFPQYFNNNDPDDGGPFYNLQYDGFTDVFTAIALGLAPGEHTIMLAIADAADEALDSVFFIQAGSFSDVPTNPAVPEPSTFILLGAGLAGFVALRKRIRK